jgi:sugar lactone lactonase YvrE
VPSFLTAIFVISCHSRVEENMSRTVEPIVEQHAQLGEGSIWHPPTQRLYWVDIMGETLFVYDPESDDNRSIHLGTHVSTVVPRKSGGVMLAVKGGFASLDLETESLTEIAMVESDRPNNRFNDGKCDPAGRFWAGSIAYDFAQGAASLYCMEQDLSVKKVLADVSISNGLVWTADQATMYYIDSLTYQVAAFDYDVDTGDIANRRVIVEIPEADGFIDGMSIDVNGNLWVAVYQAGEVRCWNPANGELLDVVNVPGAKLTTSCAFGGPNLDQLYITSAAGGLSADELKEQPLAGSLFRADMDVTGVPAFEFLG